MQNIANSLKKSMSLLFSAGPNQVGLAIISVLLFWEYTEYMEYMEYMEYTAASFSLGEFLVFQRVSRWPSFSATSVLLWERLFLLE